MKQVQFYFSAILFLLLFNTETFSQDIVEAYKANQQTRNKQWEDHKYEDAIKGMLPIYQNYLQLDEKKKNKHEWIAQSLTYNLACAYSLTNQKEEAIKHLQLSYKYGWKNYYHILKDSDLDNIRKESGYKELLVKFKEVGDYVQILKKDARYSDIHTETPPFSYQNADELKEFRLKYNLDSVAGNGDEFSKIVNLMSWVNHMVRHDGSSQNPKDKTADALIKVCKAENRGINCRMMATILNEAYLSMGFKSRFVTCMPKGEKFNDCHVINVVYSKQFGKWLWMDPSFETYVMDENNAPLSIQEVRQKLCNKEPMKVYNKIHWNDKKYSGGGKRYLYEYMTKNLYRFSTPLVSMSGFESSKEKRVYVELYPIGYNPKNITLNKKTEGQRTDTYYLVNDDVFWVKPE